MEYGVSIEGVLEQVARPDLPTAIQRYLKFNSVKAVFMPEFFIQAKVDRTDGIQMVHFETPRGKTGMSRRCCSPDGERGEIGVSCEPEGSEVPVESVNIRFLEYDDPLTDRGIIWVIPGDPTFAFCTFQRLNTIPPEETIAQIIDEAEAALDEFLSKIS